MRLLHTISEGEQRYFCRKGTPCHRAWESLFMHMGRRDTRGVKKWVFVMGWLACTAHHRISMKKAYAKITENLEEAERVWRDESGISLIEGNDNV